MWKSIKVNIFIFNFLKNYCNNSTKDPIISLKTLGTKSSVINIAVPTPKGIVINRERNEVTNVPYIAVKAPY